MPRRSPSVRRRRSPRHTTRARRSPSCNLATRRSSKGARRPQRGVARVERACPCEGRRGRGAPPVGRRLTLPARRRRRGRRRMHLTSPLAAASWRVGGGGAAARRARCSVRQQLLVAVDEARFASAAPPPPPAAPRRATPPTAAAARARQRWRRRWSATRALLVEHNEQLGAALLKADLATQEADLGRREPRRRRPRSSATLERDVCASRLNIVHRQLAERRVGRPVSAGSGRRSASRPSPPSWSRLSDAIVGARRRAELEAEVDTRGPRRRRRAAARRGGGGRTR